MKDKFAANIYPNDSLKSMNATNYSSLYITIYHVIHEFTTAHKITAIPRVY